ncbi:MAG: hypothetical protein ABSF97_04985 [Candidatus Sulfotelmatobacter sp.]|jgi:hypothetical protein
MNTETSQTWEEVYRAAVLEPDKHKLAGKLDAASMLLIQRLLEIGAAPEHATERERLTDALLTLDTIRRIEIKVPA